MLSARLPRNVNFIKHLPKFYTTETSIESSNGNKNNCDSFPKEAEVVIIGGGSIGCNTLYHLTKLGVNNVVLLEKNKLTSGTTWHTAGLIWSLRPNDVDIELYSHTRHLLKDVLKEETGVDPGWINNGGLFIASNTQRLKEYERLKTIGKMFGIESFLLNPQETKELYPLLETSDIVGSLYSPSDGTVDPTGMCTALTRASTTAGAKIFEDCSVTGIDTQVDEYGTNRIQAVQTSNGPIKTNCVVNGSGVWAPYIGKLAEVNIPQVAMKHAYVVTAAIDGVRDKPNVRDHDLSLYLKLQGDVLQIGGYEPNPIFLDRVEEDFSFGLYDLDWDVFSFNSENAIKRMPIIASTNVPSTVCGPESFTPDHKPIVGEDPTLRGFFHASGCNSMGMNLGGGIGRELSKWIVHGHPDLDMFGYDIRRFYPGLTANQKWIKERSHEAYAKNYSIVFPNDQPLASRNMRKDPFHGVLLKAGCFYQEAHGWERPGWFSPDGPSPILPYDYYGNYEHDKHENYKYFDRLKNDYSFDFPKQHDLIRNEVLCCRERVAVFNMSYFGKFYLTGPDAKKAADWIYTNHVTKPAGATTYTCMCNKRGGVEADLTVSAINPGEGSACDPQFEGYGYYIAAGGGAAQQNWSHILTVIQDNKFDVSLTDYSEEMGMLSIQGPKSRDVLNKISDADLSNENFKFSTNQIINVAGHKVRALRLTFVGELGWELHIPKESCIEVYKAIMKAGEEYGIGNAGYRAIDSLSLEKGYRHWHADIRSDDTPLEGGLAFTCKFKTDIDFLGRNALVQQKKDGLQRKLACFTVDEYVPLVGMEIIYRNDETVGFVRRADYAFALGKSMCYGYIAKPDKSKITNDYLKEGDYKLESYGKIYTAKLHLKSLFDPKNERIKGIYSS
ncbi:Sarcosine dehydrogenase, mitochondrial [Nymphon striatum]|nr:Sarcosine dehydrogenase, mitochondrial [Nymphon striatum]